MADRFAYVSKAFPVARDTARAFGDTMKTFAIGQYQPEDERVFPGGEGPAPVTSKPPEPPDVWYKSYGRYAPPVTATKQRGTF